MKRSLTALALCLWLTPALAGSIAVTPGSGTTVGAGSDGTAQIPATILCGATASATLYATCVNQAIVNASGQLLTLNTQGTSPWIIAGGGTAGVSGTAVLTIQGIASGTAVPISGALTANQSVNVAQVNGVTTLTGTGAVGTGSARVAVGTDTATIAGSAPGTAGSASTNVVTVQGIASGTPLAVSPGPYPATAVPITASTTGTTAATTATLTAVSGHTTYICGFSIRANATAAATNNATVTGTITGTLNFTQWTAPLASGLGVTEEAFVPCIPASAVTTNIAVVSGAPGTGGVVSVTAWGYSI